MRIYKNSLTKFNLPIEITSRTEPLKQTQVGYVRKSTSSISFIAIKSNKMRIKTERIKEFNKQHQLIKCTDIIDRNDKTQTIVCTPIKDELMDENYTKEIGYKTDVVLLNCDNDSQMKMQSMLQKSNQKGFATYVSKKNYMMSYNDTKHTIEETIKMTIDTEGKIHRITEKVKVKDLFSISYRVKDIKGI